MKNRTFYKFKDNSEQQARRNFKLANLVVMLAVLLIALSAITIFAVLQSKERGEKLENYYQKSLYEVADNMDNIEVKLSKIMASNSDYQTALLASDVWRTSDNAASNIAQLPLESTALSKATDFVNQLGDYSYSLSKKLQNGGELSDEDHDTLERLHESSVSLKNSVRDLTEKAATKTRMLNYNRISQNAGNRNKKPQAFDSSFDEMEKGSVDYPKMIYDGPFSESTTNKRFTALKTAEDVSSEQAAARLKKLFGKTVQDIVYRGEAGGDLKTYEFAMQLTTGDVYAQVTQKGGYIYMLSANRAIKTAAFTEDEAIAKAEDFAAAAGFEGMKAVWYNVSDNAAFINLAYEQEGVRIYPDLVKVKLALDNGEILGLESSAYCNSHTTRTALKPTISENTAVSKLSGKLQINSRRLAVIPRDGQKELLVYEFECEYKGLDYFVYIDAFDGAEADIQRVVNDAQGKMLM